MQWLPLLLLCFQQGGGLLGSRFLRLPHGNLLALRTQTCIHLTSRSHDDVAAAMAIMDTGDLATAERLLVSARAQDPNRDMPRHLHLAFCRLFGEYGKIYTNELWPLEALASLHTDAEEWDDVLEACSEVQRRTNGTLSPTIRMRRFHAARASFYWTDDLDRDNNCAHSKEKTSSGRNIANSMADTFIEREASELAAFTGPSTVVPPFTALSMPLSPKTCATIAKAYLERSILAAVDAVAAEPLPPLPLEPSGPSPTLTVGFITPDANGAHPLGQLMAGTFRHFRKHEVILFSLCRNDNSPERTEFEIGTKAVIDVTSWKPRDIAAEIRRQGVHVLVDLCGHAGTTDVTEVLAMRPAALQIQGAMGTPAPMGDAPTTARDGMALPVYDYAITDSVCVPNEALPLDPTAWGWGGDFEHKALRLPYTYFVCDHARASRHVWTTELPDRRHLGLPPSGEGVVLVCMNRGHKVDEQTFLRWLRILKRTEQVGTVLWMLAPSTKSRSRLRDTASYMGVDPLRIVFADIVPRQIHLHRLRVADLALDTRMYNSHTLAADYAWAGVPMVTGLYDSVGSLRATERSTELPHEANWASRVGASIVSALGLGDELIASDWDDAYEDLAIELALDRLRLDKLKQFLARGRNINNIAPLWNTALWAASVEQGIDIAWPARPKDDGIQSKEWVDITLQKNNNLRDSNHGLLGERTKVIVLDRERRVENFHEIEKRLPGARRFPAIDAIRSRESAVVAAKNLKITFAAFWEAQATSGQIGCAISHAMLWKEVSLSDTPWTLILEDDALPHRTLFTPVVSRIVKELESSVEKFDLAYLYVHPEHRPNSMEMVATYEELERIDSDGGQWTQKGYHTWCLLAYIVSKEGAQKLLKAIEDPNEDIYCPIDNWVSDLRERKILRTICPTTSAWISKIGQIDMREQSEDGTGAFLPSNLWNSPLWSDGSAKN
jgi:predicted O-linked N-acetylglucosamine transferase (SPINDLY family)/GR25 family glycosyltransferase involved in LPS biosynthesis